MSAPCPFGLRHYGCDCEPVRPELPEPPRILPLQAKPVWVVEVRVVEVDGLSSDEPFERLADNDRRELYEKYGYGDDDEALLEALGPDDGYTPTFHWGPYTEKQAEALAEWLNLPEVQKQQQISGARACPLHRYPLPVRGVTRKVAR